MSTTKITRRMCLSFFALFFLTLSGGIQDAYAYFFRDGVFANAQTGNVVFLSVYLFSGDFGNCLRYLPPILFFVFGVFLARTIQMFFQKREYNQLRFVELIIQVLILISVAFIPHEHNTWANSLISFVSAMQVQTFKSINGHVFGSTMCIGNLLRASESLTTFFSTRSSYELKKSLFYWFVVILFGIGAGVGYVLLGTLNEYTILVSAACLLLSGIIVSFGYEE